MPSSRAGLILAELGTTPEALLAQGRATRQRSVEQAHRLFDASWARAH
jgi:hypothetical protein